MTEGESLILTNARVWTGAASKPWAEAVAVCGGRIAAVGDEAEAADGAGQGARRIDLGGRLVIPGFVDSHVHALTGGQVLAGLDLSGAESQEEFVECIRRAVEAASQGSWVVGRGWNASRWAGGGCLHKRMIDGFSENAPIFLTRTDGHIGLANSCALDHAGITTQTADPTGGRIDRDEAGAATGIVRDAAMRLVWAAVPEPGDDEKARLLAVALEHAAARGITTLVDLEGAQVHGAYLQLAARGALASRVVRFPPLSRLEEAVELKESGPWADGMLSVAGVKAFVDGSLGARTAWMDEPYSDDPANSGLAMAGVEDGSLEASLTDAYSRGLSLAVHAIGDRANHVLLDIFERIRGRFPGMRAPLRIEHVQHLCAGDVARFGELDVVASMQPLHIPLDAPYLAGALGEGRARLSYAERALADAGACIVLGTDWPVVELDCLGTIAAAAAEPPFAPGAGALSVEEALRAYTLGAAEAAGVADVTGTIEPGKSADLAVLSENIFELDAAEIARVKVEMTVASGRAVYRAPSM